MRYLYLKFFCQSTIIELLQFYYRKEPQVSIAQLFIASVILLLLSFPQVTIRFGEAPINYQYVLAHTKRDLDCLAKNIYFEARGESQRGKIAVAQVTLNRVRHPGEFSKTICGVVYQKDQFSWTNLPKQTIKDLQQWEESLHIARGVLHGKMFLENFDALYFHASYVKPQWRATKQYIRTIGKHIFYI
jgi:spore germination cell wall hydrolase CwlJ-like protein